MTAGQALRTLGVRRGRADDVVVADTYDRQLFAQLAREVPELACVLGKRPERVDLLRDLLLLLWQASPRLRGREEMSLTHLAHHAIVTGVAGMREAGQARGFTVHDGYASALACVALAPVLRRGGDGDNTLAEALQDVTEELRAQTQVFASCGTLPGQLRRYPPAERASLASRLSTRPLALALSKVGRFRLTGIEQTVYGQDVVGVELSDRLEDVRPSELLLLSAGLARHAFLQKLADGQLLTRHRGAPAAGPLVLCLDTSASMTRSVVEGAPRVAWAKAFAVAIWRLARTKSNMSVVVFGAAGEHLVRTLSDLHALAEVLEAGFGGGTDFVSVLDVAFDQVRVLREAGQGDAHIIFVSDGECELTTEQLQRVAARKSELSAFVHGVTVGTEKDSVNWLFADTVTSLSDHLVAA